MLKFTLDVYYWEKLEMNILPTHKPTAWQKAQEQENKKSFCFIHLYYHWMMHSWHCSYLIQIRSASAPGF